MWILFLILLQLTATKIQVLGMKLDSQKMGFTYLNKQFIYNGSMAIFQYNDTSKAHNISFYNLQELPNDLRFAVDVYKFAAKAFRSFPFPYELDANVCEMFAKNEFGVRLIYDFSNFRGCPFKKSTYYVVENFNLDDRKLPTMPTGKYKLVGKLFSNVKNLTYARTEWFVNVLTV